MGRHGQATEISILVFTLLLLFSVFFTLLGGIWIGPHTFRGYRTLPLSPGHKRGDLFTSMSTTEKGEYSAYNLRVYLSIVARVCCFADKNRKLGQLFRVYIYTYRAVYIHSRHSHALPLVLTTEKVAVLMLRKRETYIYTITTIIRVLEARS